MTPKEKAKELFDKMNVIHYVKLYDKNKDSKGLPVSMYNFQIKQCALIAVDELIKEELLWLQEVGGNESESEWIKVKQEINNL
jgi:hypothetical protein